MHEKLILLNPTDTPHECKIIELTIHLWGAIETQPSALDKHTCVMHWTDECLCSYMPTYIFRLLL